MADFTDQEFWRFCVEECYRLGTFPSYRFLAKEAKRSYCEWFYQKAQGDAQKVKCLIDELINRYAKIPMISELGAIWLRMFPVIHERPAVICDVCQGTGYQNVGSEMVWASKRCPQGCLVPDGTFQRAVAETKLPSVGVPTPSEGQPHSTRGRLRQPTAEAASGLLFE